MLAVLSSTLQPRSPGSLSERRGGRLLGEEGGFLEGTVNAAFVPPLLLSPVGTKCLAFTYVALKMHLNVIPPLCRKV